MKNFVSGNRIQQEFYKSFQPEKINRPFRIDDGELISLLSLADRHLGRLDMYSEYVPNIDMFIRMHVYKEATSSSRIEGTQTNIEEALQDKDDIVLDKRDDWEEVQNYVKAMNQAIGMLDTLPFSTRLIRETHRILLDGVRGKEKEPGEFRRSQNWIGGHSINEATFIPPVYSSIPDLMSDIEFFAHNDELYVPELLKIALIHYQFETIHPFLDGNGRTGRLMITLYLVSKGILKKPVLYLSDYFERHRALYYDHLMLVREKNDLNRWFKFFLSGVIETAKNSIATFDNILKLKKETDVRLQTLGRRFANASKVVQYLYQKPYVDALDVKNLAGITGTSAYKLLEDLEKIGILEEITGHKRGRLYIFRAYMELFR